MKKSIRRMLALGMAIVMSLALAACAQPDSGNEFDDQQVDTSKTQLYVFNFNGGYGAAWLSALKERYEELHKDDVFEEGKKGVQIVVNNNKGNADAFSSQILSNRDEVYFTEYAYYYTLLQSGILGDITEAVTGDLGAYGDPAGTTILSKLSDEQKEFYGVLGEDGEYHYYGVPHYAGYNGIVYNVDLFEQEGYYFADGVESSEFIEDYFIVRSTDKKSAGPDGKYDTYDDGLPANEDEFFLLCEYIASRGHTPISWNGSHHNDYLGDLGQALQANAEGAEQMKLNYSMNGEATSLGSVINGEFVLDSAPTTLTAKNGYQVQRQAGKYYTLSFLEKLIKNEKYHGQLNFNSAYTHMNAQEDFLYAGHDGGATAPIAMLVEGIWWENEASATFESMEDSMGSAFGRNSRRFALMPLPKIGIAEAGENVMVEKLYSLCFMKANIAEEKKALAYDFIMFANTNASLVEFTQITNTPKNMNYTLTEEEMASLSPFGRSVFEVKQNSTVIYPYSKEPVYVNQPGMFAAYAAWKSTVGGVFYNGPAMQFNENKLDATAYFNGMLDYYSENWNQFKYE